MNLKQKNKYIEDLIIKCYKLQQENQELKKLNIAQVRENAQIRIEKAKIEKQLSELKNLSKERIVEVLRKRAKKIVEKFIPDKPGYLKVTDKLDLGELTYLDIEQIASEILGDDENE